MTDQPKPLVSDLGQFIFDMAVAMNKVYAAGLGIDRAGHYAQVERMQEKLDNAPASEFERSVPSLPEGKAACARLSCQRICDQEELSERGYCLQCERLDLTRVQLWFGSPHWDKWYNAKTNQQVWASCSEIAARFLLSELTTNIRQYEIEPESQYLNLADVEVLLQSFIALAEERQK